ncbi:O-antigen ligase family protein [Gilvimarinus sp. F26214L]|uniref:O-antigen ligase family protein n=1 Tax=Gilvimarinus sp. DZF01 TaxID=3461371 RepID=UPI004045E243
MARTISIGDFYAFRAWTMLGHFFRDHFSFWMICLYLFFEYFRPQAIYPVIDVAPWAQIFIIAALVGALFDRSVTWVSHRLNFWMVLFAGIIYLSSVFAYFPEVSREYYIDFYGWFVIYFLIINIVNTKERFYIFLMIFLFCAAKIALGTSLSWASRGFSFTDWGLMGPRGYFQNSGELAILMLTLFPVAFYLFLEMRKKEQVRWWEKGLLFAFFAAPLLTILGASSRGAQIALAVTLVLMYRRNIFRIKPMIAVAVLLVASVFLLPEEQKERFTQIGEDRTSQQRMLYLENGWEMMKEYPVLGVGYFNFPPYFAMHYPEDIITVNEQAELAHNIFIQVGTDAGFVGLAVFMMLILTGIRTAFRLRSEPGVDSVLSGTAAGLGYGIIGFVIAGQFVTVAYYPFLWIGLSFIVALNNVAIRHEVTEPNRKVFPEREGAVSLNGTVRIH